MCLKISVMIYVIKLVSHVSSHVTQTEHATYSTLQDSMVLQHRFRSKFALSWLSLAFAYCSACQQCMRKMRGPKLT